MAATETESNRREGRGRLSSIDMLPEEADEAIAWANAALRDRSMPQTEILREFNARLADLGIKGVSKGAFSRHSVKVAVEMRNFDAQRRITEAVFARIQPGERGDSMIAATELLKFRIMQLITDQDESNGKDLAAASLALSRISTISAREAELRRRAAADQRDEDARAKAERDAAEQAELAREQAELAEEVGKIATDAGLGADRIAAIRRGVLGLSV